MIKRKFFIDTDTASDDAVALLMALETPDVEVLGVSIVSGNMPVEQGSINARYTIELCKKDTPVYVGYDKPMLKKREHADWFHGPDGMGNMNYPEPKSSENKSDYKEVLNKLSFSISILKLIISPFILLLISYIIFDSGLPKEIPGAFFVSVAPCGVTSIVLCSAYNVSPENIIKAIFISTFASIATIFFAIQYLTTKSKILIFLI